jgi:opacity protein-like surface antigen
VKGNWKKWLLTGLMLVAPAAQGATVWEPKVRLTAEERYDDDLRLGDGAAGGQLMTKLTPRLGVEGGDGRLKLDGFYAADLLMRHGSGKVTLDHRAGLEAHHVLTRRLKVDSAVRVFRVTDPSSLPRDGLARSTSPTFFTQANLSATARTTERLDVRAGYKFEAVRILESGQQAGYAHTPSLEAWYRATRRLSLGMEYRYQGFLYQGDLAQANGVAAGLRYRLTRPTTLLVRAGPVYYVGANGLERGWVPRVNLELQREGELLDVGVAVGHDLVGASGFANAVWADYASLILARRFTQRFNAFGAASFFRNGRAPDQQWGVFSGSPLVSQGYALSGGVEYRINRRVAAQGAVDRIAQVGVAETAGAADLTRNVFAVRLVVTPW